MRMPSLGKYLGGLALCAGLALGAAPAAHAQTIPSLPSGCTIISGTSTSAWPNGNYSGNCGGTSQDATAMLNGVSVNNFGRNLQKQGIQLFLFSTPAAYKTALGSKAATVPAGAWSVTGFDSNNTPVHIAIFEKNDAGTAITNSPAGSNGVGHYLIREEGRALDTLLGYVTTLGVVSYPYPSISTANTTEFASEVNADWTYLNSLSNCGTGGIFVNQKDPRNGNFICANNGQGPGLAAGYSGTNQAIITLMIPDVYTNSNDVWSELYAASRNTPVQNLDYYLHGFQNWFPCSYQYQHVVEQQGRKPIDLDFSSITQGSKSCPKLSQPPFFCTQVFSTSGGSNDFSFPGWGYVFDCTGNPSTMTSQLTLNMSAFGRTQGQTQPPKSTLSSYGQYIYVFALDSTFQSVFTGGGVPLNGQSINGNNGVTFPYQSGTLQTWYTIINQGSSAGTNAGKQAYINSHELGHTIDFKSGQPSDGTKLTGFDLAMQNDWLFIDYTTYPTMRLPCATTPYTGPLVGLTDPSTGNPYCANGVLGPGEGYLAGKRNSAILQANVAFGRTGEIELYYQTTTGALGINSGISAKAGWREWFPQALAVQAAPDVNGVSNLPNIDTWVSEGYFSCTAGTGRTGSGGGTLKKGWLYYVYHGQTVSLPAGCNTALPNGYVAVY